MSTPNRSRVRRLALGVALSLAVIAIVWQIAKRAADVDRYRPQIESALAEYTGLPVAIGSLDLAWHPVPCLSAHDVSIGGGDFHALSLRLDVFPRLWPLLRRRVEIARIQLAGAEITLPRSREELDAQWRNLFARIDAARAAQPASSEAQVRIEKLIAGHASLRFGQQDPHPILISITATGLSDPEIELSLDAEVPSAGLHASGELRIPLHEEGEVAGELEIHRAQPARFAELPTIAHAEWDAHAELSGTFAKELALKVQGRFVPLADGALGGRFDGHAKIAPDGKTRADLEIIGEGLSIESSARLFAGEKSRVRIKSAHASGAALATLIQAIPRDPFQLSTVAGAALEVRGLDLALEPEPRLVAGSIQGHGVSLEWNGTMIAPDLHLDARAAEGSFQIASLRGGPVDLRGVITPLDGLDRVALDLTGTVALDAALLRALGAPEALQEASGSIALEQLRTELPTPADGNVPLAVRAQLANGALRIESDALQESISGISLQLTGETSALRLEGRAVGAALGPLTMSADFEPNSGALRGNLALMSASADFLRGSPERTMLTPVFRAYSGAPLAFDVTRQEGEQRIRIERTSAPRVSAALELRAEPASDPLRNIEITADLPAEALRGFLPEAAQASGTGSLRMLRASGAATFSAEADLAPVRLSDGDYLEKKPGEVLRVRVDGSAGKSWRAHTLTIAAERGAIPLQLGEHGVSARNLDVDLEGFSFLLIDTARASGRLKGNFDSATESAELHLEDVGLWLSPGVGVDDADGTIAVSKGDWGIRGLRVRGKQSDATFDAAVQRGELRGKLTGARLDADFVRALLEQIHALHFVKREPDTSPPISGTLGVAVDHVSYRRAEAERFSAAIQFEQDDIHARNLAFAVGEGRVWGRVDVDLREPEPPLLDLELEFSNLPRSFVDALLNDESLGTPGSWAGKLRFTAPLHADLKAMMPDASGSLVATARDGTLIGRIGLATKIVTVLRSTEALRMRLPAFRDEGLVYDQVRGELVMQQGRLEIRTFELDSTSYAISATGEVNFREDTSRIPIEVDAIRGITSLVERVPLAGDALKIVDVRLVATGSPWDMRVRVASIQDQLIGAGLAGPKAVINGMRDVMNLMRAAGGTLSGAPNAEPAPESPPPVPEPPPGPEPTPSPQPSLAPSP